MTDAAQSDLLVKQLEAIVADHGASDHMQIMAVCLAAAQAIRRATPSPTWRDGIEAAAKVARGYGDHPALSDTEHHIAYQIAKRIDALSPPSSEQDGGT